MEQYFESVFNNIITTICKVDETFRLFIELVENFEGNNCYIAGGVVRDSLIFENFIPKDVDIFITSIMFNHIRDFIENRGRLIINPFGSVRWYPSENSQFYYDIIIIENFYNGLWKCENLSDVLNQFDITANAVAFDLKTKVFYDPCNGYLHIKRKELRAVRFDYPEINLSDKIPLSRNSILWFRYNYYAKKLGFSIDLFTQNWINENRYRIKDQNLFTKYFFNPDNIS